MHRQPLLDMLARYAAANGNESKVAEQIASLVRNHADCFDRTCRPGHITGSAWVLSEDRCRCLLVHHRKLGRWLQPGGHADGQSDVAAVALREVSEETGLADVRLAEDWPQPLDIDVHTIPARTDAAGNEIEDTHEHHDVRFLVIAHGDSALTVSDESHEVRWLTRYDVLQLTDEPSVLRMLEKAGPV